MNEPSVHGPKQTPLGVGGWLVIIALGSILGASIWFAFYGWNLTDGQVSRAGMIALALGVVFSMVLGGGLMALVFWSNKKGYDR
jgi:TRAP-type C4-dicarboxylate transport system permease small subunit